MGCGLVLPAMKAGAKLGCLRGNDGVMAMALAESIELVAAAEVGDAGQEMARCVGPGWFRGGAGH